MVNHISVSHVTPYAKFSDVILEGAMAYGELAGKITIFAGDVNAGEGNSVNIRTFPERVAQGPLTYPGPWCLSEVSTTISTASFTIGRYGDYDKMFGYPLWQAKEPVKAGVLNMMAKGLAKKQDRSIFHSMCTTGKAYKAGYTAVCAEPSTCSSLTTYGYKFTMRLTESVCSIVAAMRGGGYNPDYIILHPTVAKFLYYRDMTTSVPFTTIGPDMKAKTFCGLNVIESANCTTITASGVAGSTCAIIIDSSRAVAEAYGKRPTFEEARIPDCDYWKSVVWMYWGCGVVDRNAIGHVQNN